MPGSALSAIYFHAPENIRQDTKNAPIYKALEGVTLINSAPRIPLCLQQNHSNPLHFPLSKAPSLAFSAPAWMPHGQKAKQAGEQPSPPHPSPYMPKPEQGKTSTCSQPLACCRTQRPLMHSLFPMRTTASPGAPCVSSSAGLLAPLQKHKRFPLLLILSLKGLERFGTPDRCAVGQRVEAVSLSRAGAGCAEHLPAGASVLVMREVGLMAGISGRERGKCLKERGRQLWAAPIPSPPCAALPVQTEGSPSPGCFTKNFGV